MLRFTTCFYKRPDSGGPGCKVRIRLGCKSDIWQVGIILVEISGIRDVVLSELRIRIFARIVLALGGISWLCYDDLQNDLQRSFSKLSKSERLGVVELE